MITGLIAVLAAVDSGLSTVTTRRVAEARGAGDDAAVVEVTREAVSVALRLAVVVMPLVALAGWPIMHVIAPPASLVMDGWLWLGVVIYQTVGWYFAMEAGAATGLQRGDLANAANALGAVVGAVVTVVAVLAGLDVYGLLVGMWALGIVTLAGHLRNARHLTGTTAVWRPQRAVGRPRPAGRRCGARVLTGVAAGGAGRGQGGPLGVGWAGGSRRRRVSPCRGWRWWQRWPRRRRSAGVSVARHPARADRRPGA